MRIAAGVLLIIVAVANLTGGLIYAGLGALLGVTGDAAEDGSFSMTVTDESRTEQTVEIEDGSFSSSTEAADPGEGEKVEIQIGEAGREMKKAGGIVTIWGLFLLVLGGLDIAAGVMLFTLKKPTFIMVTAGLELLADLGTIAMTQTFVWSTIGIVAAILAFVAAKSMAASPDSA